MTNSEFSDFIGKLQAMGTGPNPTREEQLRYAATHGPDDDHCTLCGKERCACWRDEPQFEPLVPHSVMVSQIAAAVAAEREACAKIAESYVREPVRNAMGERIGSFLQDAARNGTARNIAATIRARKDTE